MVVGTAITAGFVAVIVFAGLSSPAVSQAADGADSVQSAPANPAGTDNSAQVAAAVALKKELQDFIQNRQANYSIYIKPMPQGEPVMIHPVKMRAASMIKVYIMAEAFAQIEAGQLSLDDTIRVSAGSKVGGAGSLQSVADGTAVSVRELIRKMIVESDNTATNLLISRLSMERINARIAALGGKDTSLQRLMMDLNAPQSGRENYVSAADLGLFFEKLYQQDITQHSDTMMLDILKQQEDNDKIPAWMPPGVVVAHKTGELDGIMHDGGIVYGGKQDFVICVLTEGPVDPKEIANIAAITYRFYNK